MNGTGTPLLVRVGTRPIGRKRKASTHVTAHEIGSPTTSKARHKLGMAINNKVQLDWLMLSLGQLPSGRMRAPAPIKGARARMTKGEEANGRAVTKNGVPQIHRRILEYRFKPTEQADGVPSLLWGGSTFFIPWFSFLRFRTLIVQANHGCLGETAMIEVLSKAMYSMNLRRTAHTES